MPNVVVTVNLSGVYDPLSGVGTNVAALFTTPTGTASAAVGPMLLTSTGIYGCSFTASVSVGAILWAEAKALPGTNVTTAAYDAGGTVTLLRGLLGYVDQNGNILTSAPAAYRDALFGAQNQLTIDASNRVKTLDSAGNAFTIPTFIVQRSTPQFITGLSITLNSGAPAVADPVGMMVAIVSGLGVGQSRIVKSYDHGVAQIDRAWATNPDTSSVYELWALGTDMVSLFTSDALLTLHGAIIDGPDPISVNADGSVDANVISSPVLTTQSGTAQAATSTTITLAAGASAVNNTYKNQLLVITGGTGAGQCSTIIGYDGSTKIATLQSTWVTTPDDTSTYVVLPAGASAGGTARNLTLAQRNVNVIDN